MPESIRDALMKAVLGAAKDAERRGELTPALDMAKEVAASAARVAEERLAAIQARKRNTALQGLEENYDRLGLNWVRFRVYGSHDKITERGINRTWRDLERRGRELIVNVSERAGMLRQLASGMYLDEQFSGSYQYYMQDVERADPERVSEMFGNPPGILLQPGF